MSRALPLENPAEAIDDSAGSTRPTTELAGAIAVYDPAMCCSTGLCGPGVDPVLMAIARDLRWLERQGVEVRRFGLSQEPDEFVSNTRIGGLMQAFGDAALPAVLINDTVFCFGRYPSRAEMVGALRAPATAPDNAAPCCTPGSGCC